ncbi:MAG: hypothetical protein H6592_11300 [Flavobacteriales bacterium]|nr:hypothetical protein [Flavobacteriales bacterium]
MKIVLVAAIALISLSTGVHSFSMRDMTGKKVAIVRVSGYEPDITEGAIISYLMDAGVEVFDRMSITKVLDEQKFQLSGLVDESTAVEVGKITGVQYVLVASTSNPIETNRANWKDNTWSTFSLSFTCKLIEVETSKVMLVGTTSANRGFPNKAVEDAIKKFFTKK